MLGSTIPNGEGEPFFVTSQRFELVVSDTTLAPVAGVIPLTYDQPQEPGEQSADTHGISDFIGNEYIVHRLLGSLFIERTVNWQGDPVGVTDWPAVIVTAGFFVARAADGQSDFSDGVPVGWDTQDAWAEYSPQHIKNIRQPWSWRRTWVLGTASWGSQPQIGSPVSTGGLFQSFPINNYMYGNMSDGRVDIKSRRRIHQDERYWLVVGARPMATALIASSDTSVVIDIDLRMFGSLRKARNSGSF